MGSLALQLWMRVGTMNRRGTRASAAASWSAAVLCRFRIHEAIQSASGLAHSKTWRWSGRFMERGSVDDFLFDGREIRATIPDHASEPHRSGARARRRRGRPADCDAPAVLWPLRDGPG